MIAFREGVLGSLSRSLCSILKSFPTLLVIIFLSACSPPPPPAPPPAPPAPPPAYEHVVKYSGETLGLIANWYTGKTQNWSLLRDANPNLKPQKMSIGDVVLIPAELVVRQEPLTKSAVQKFLGGRGEKKKNSPTAEESAVATQGSVETSSEVSSAGAVTDKAEEVPVKAETVPVMEQQIPPSMKEAPVSGNVPVTDTKKPEMDELDALEKELESALAERGAGKVNAAETIPAVQPPSNSAGKGVNAETPPQNDSAAAPSKAPPVTPPGTGEEVEREKLLDELLAQ